MYLKIKAITGARAEKVEHIKDNEWRVWVKEKAERNEANTRILELVRVAYPHTSVRIVSGHHSPSKIVAID